MHFLRATGPDINISEVFQGLSSGDSSSSTSSDASSGINEEVAHFNATQSLCATALIFHRKGIPSTGLRDQTFQQGAAIRIRPILIDSPKLTQSETPVKPTCFELVPWQPCIPALLLQLWPSVVTAWKDKQLATACQEELAEGPSASGPSQFEFHCSPAQISQEAQPGPATTRNKKKKTVRTGNVSLPGTIANPASPLAETSVRRSSRLNNPDGFRAIRLEREPAKKRMISIVQIDAETGKAGPVPLSVLRGWGIDCGVAPGELSIDKLLQEPSDIVPNADTTKEEEAVAQA